MATSKNITMKQFNGTDYDTLYPKTKVEQVEGAYTQQQILADSTKTLFGLGTDAVPDDIFLKLYHGMSSDVIFEATIEGSDSNYIIDLRDVDYSKYSLFAFITENGKDNDRVFVYPCFINNNGSPTGISDSYNNYYASRSRSTNESSWSTNKNSFMDLIGKSEMFLFRFNVMSITALQLSPTGFMIGFSSDPNAIKHIYGLSITNDSSSQTKIKILGLNLR